LHVLLEVLQLHYLLEYLCLLSFSPLHEDFELIFNGSELGGQFPLLPGKVLIPLLLPLKGLV
jgi:hypothetical protein